MSEQESTPSTPPATVQPVTQEAAPSVPDLPDTTGGAMMVKADMPLTERVPLIIRGGTNSGEDK